MSCENYVPEIHNQNDNDEYDSPDSDYEVESIPSSESDVEKEIKEECDKVAESQKKYVNDKNFKELNTKGFEKLNNDERILKVAKAVKESGGISVANILELQQLVRLIMATSNLEGFENFPVAEVLKLLEMVIYHANCHINSLDI
jgi:hypothetical protein